MTDALKQRNTLKKKKPSFTRQDAHKKPKLGSKWRRPKGRQSKMRLRKKGYSRSVKVGWGSPSEAKGLSRTGKNIIIIKKIEDLEKLDKNKDTAVVSRTLGQRKRADILKKAKESGIEVMNFKKIDDKLKKTEKDMAERKKKKQARKVKKESSKKELEKKAKEKEKEDKKEEEGKSEDDKKKEQVRAQEKILTKKGEGDVE